MPCKAMAHKASFLFRLFLPPSPRRVSGLGFLSFFSIVFSSHQARDASRPWFSIFSSFFFSPHRARDASRALVFFFFFFFSPHHARDASQALVFFFVCLFVSPPKPEMRLGEEVHHKYSLELMYISRQNNLYYKHQNQSTPAVYLLGE